MTAPTPQTATATGEQTGIWGASLTIHNEVAACRHCGQILGELAEGWEAIAGRVRLDAEDLGARVDVHNDLAAVAYVCPACVTALWVDVEPTAGKTWRDFALHA